MKKGQHSKESRARYKKLQRNKKRYQELREELQLAGVLPTEPDGAIKPERVDPAKQGNAALPEVVRQGLKESWATPDSAKPAIVAALLEPFYTEDVVLDKDGNQVRVPPSRKMLNELAKTLRMLDQTQFERDHPEDAGKAKGNGVKITNQVGVSVGALFDDIQRDIQLIQQQMDAEAASGVQADGTAKPLDAPKPNNTTSQPEANKLPDAV